MTHKAAYLVGGGVSGENFCSLWGTKAKTVLQVDLSAKHPDRVGTCSRGLESITLGDRKETMERKSEG